MKTHLFPVVRGILVDIVGADSDEVRLNSDLRRDLQADSLDLVEILTSCEEQFDLAVDAVDEQRLEKLRTVGEVVTELDRVLHLDLRNRTVIPCETLSDVVWTYPDLRPEGFVDAAEESWVVFNGLSDVSDPELKGLRKWVRERMEPHPGVNRRCDAVSMSAHIGRDRQRQPDVGQCVAAFIMEGYQVFEDRDGRYLFNARLCAETPEEPESEPDWRALLPTEEQRQLWDASDRVLENPTGDNIEAFQRACCPTDILSALRFCAETIQEQRTCASTESD